MRRICIVLLTVSSAGFGLLTGCASHEPVPPASVTVTVEPAVVSLAPGTSQVFSATVTGTTDSSVTWEATGGTLDDNGSHDTVTYTAPPTAGSYRVTATSTADPSKRATATVTAAFAPGTAIWTHQIGTSSDDDAGGVAVDVHGNILVVGTTFGTIADSNAGHGDVFIRKYDAGGEVVWTRQFGTSSADLGYGVASDPDGNVVVVGATGGAITGSSAGYTDAFARKYDPDGDVVWTRQFGSSGTDVAYAVASDDDGNVFVAGATNGAMEGINAGGDDVFVTKYASNGDLQWTRQFGTSSGDRATGVVSDGAGNVMVTGTADRSLAGGSPGSIFPFVRKYDPNGDLKWTLQFGAATGDEASGIAAGGNGSMLVTGETGGDLAGHNAGFSDAFARKYDASSAVVWTRQFGTGVNDSATSVAVDGADDVLVAGFTYGVLGESSAGGDDAFVRKYDGNGDLVWTRQFGTSGVDHAEGVAADTQGYVAVVGSTDGALEGTNAGYRDVFVREYAP